MESATNSGQGAPPTIEARGIGFEDKRSKQSLGRDAEMFPKRLEWISVVLFIVNFVVMIFSYSIYDNEGWSLAMTAIATVTSVLLLLSVTFSIFGLRMLSQVILGIGLIGMMISVISLGIRIMQMVHESGPFY